MLYSQVLFFSRKILQILKNNEQYMNNLSVSLNKYNLMSNTNRIYVIFPSAIFFLKNTADLKKKNSQYMNNFIPN